MAGLVAVVDDLMFGARLQETARRFQIDLAFARSPEDTTALARARRPTLVIVERQSEACHPLETLGRIKENPASRVTPVLGDFSRVREDVRTAAAEAGCDELLPRSVLAARPMKILERGATATGEGCAPAATVGGAP
jgi:PleD family two-component response regulator